MILDVHFIQNSPFELQIWTSALESGYIEGVGEFRSIMEQIKYSVSSGW